MSFLAVLIYGLLGLALIGLIWQLKKKAHKRRIKRLPTSWSVGYQWVQSPFDIHPENAHVYSRFDCPAGVVGIADPFLYRHKDDIFLFFEVIVNDNRNAKLAVSKLNKISKQWEFQGLVLEESYHLSYPYVFSHGDDIYMIPETKKNGAVQLYKAIEFPGQWRLEKTLLDNNKYVDSSIIFWQGYFYLFTSRKRKLFLYYAKSLSDDWALHPSSPVKRYNHARCAGRIFEENGQLYRFAQEQAKGYGMGMRRYIIRELSTTAYREAAVEKGLFLKPFGQSWAQYGMHHLDILRLNNGEYLSVFDGKGVISSSLSKNYLTDSDEVHYSSYNPNSQIQSVN